MPKLPKATIDLTGVSIKQIMNLDIDINKLSRGDLSRVVGRLVSASNKRIRNLAKTEIGQLSPAYQSRMKHGGLFTTAGMNRNQLEHAFAETKGFLQLKTSSVKGWENVRKEIVKGLEKGVEETTGQKVDLSELLSSETKSKKFWKTYREATDGKYIPNKDIQSRYNSDRIQELLAVRYNRESGFHGFGQKQDDVVNWLTEEIEQRYREEQNEDYEDVDEDDGTEIDY